MARLLWLADVARTAGLKVVEVDGWQDRGKPTMVNPPSTVIAHHTATSAKAKGDLPSIGILRDGRPDLPGPLCHYGLGRSGTVYVIASGKANHAGPGTWRGVSSSVYTIGIEAEHPGDSSPWPNAQLDAYDRLSAAVLTRIGADRHGLCAHREWATPPGRKPDPTGIDMNAMRRRVHLLQTTSEGDPLSHLTADEQRTVLEAARSLLAVRPDLMGDPAQERSMADHARFAHLDAFTTLQEVRELRREVADLRAQVAALKGTP